MISASEGTMGGYKEIVAEVQGRGAFAKLKFESGVHRVQRVPDTETQGRIHTSAATVAVLPEVEDVDVNIKNDDLRIETMRAQGAGGQHVNKTESAIRITHIPTGIVVMMQDSRSQHKNRASAMNILRSRIYDAEQQRINAVRSAERKEKVGSGDRSERIRTYNFPQGRVTDHRINLTLYKLPQVIAGEALGELTDALTTEHQAAQLAAQGARVSRPCRPCERDQATGALLTDSTPPIEAAARAACACDGADLANSRSGRTTIEIRAISARCASLLIGHVLGLDLTGLITSAQRQLTADRIGAARRLRAPSSRRRTGRAHCRREGILGTAAETVAGDAGAAAGYRDRGRTGAGIVARRWRHQSPAAYRRSRHRLRRDPAGACCRSCRRRTDSAPTSRSRRCKPPPPTPPARGWLTRATFIACDYASGLSGPFDLIVSNPPYIRAADIDGLAVEVRNHDPRAALDGGADGLDAYRALIPQAAGLLAPGAALIVEAGEGQSGLINGLMTMAGLTPTGAPKADLGGIPRAVAARKMPR